MNKRKWLKLTTGVIGLVMALVMVLSVVSLLSEESTDPIASSIKKLEGNIDTNMKDYLDSSVVYKLPDTVKDTDVLSVIVRLEDEPLLDLYAKSDKKVSFTEYALSDEADALRDKIAEKKSDILTRLDREELKYGIGADYAAILSGFELTLTAKDFKALCDILGDDATAIVGEVYEISETELVDNKVNVYDTGIFNSSEFAEKYGYDGEGIVVAVLDTGLDYYHTAFSVDNFTADRNNLGLTFDEVSSIVGDTRASKISSGLTASDVYVNEKVPFAFDYADYDPDVYPISSDHGTHVAGVIAGKDDVITGVAPNAQLAIMKTFSDTMSSARSSWILSALEDCVVLGVDVINMSLGTPCGFSRESDKEQISGVYDRIRESGISMVVAASNSFNSTYGSEKNGNLGLTSNPDSATIGSPATYAGALSVASINGVKTSYLLYNNTIMYFTESTDRVAEEKNFVEDLLGDDKDSIEIEYVTIPGVGRSADYSGIDVAGKIALIRRGDTTFEEKANTAEKQGAAGVIIYNNVSGEIKMNVGDTKIAVCSIRQDDGEKLAEAGTGTIKISREQASGPFMSDFSSWGPSPDLEIKPEITAHGGYITSAVPGQGYEEQSGTSMACPNVSGLTALLRQYVIENFPEIADDSVKVAAFVNQLLMSTADIVFNTNGLPYAVRKQGAGLANLLNAAATEAYITTFDREDGSLMDKTKIELGDDPDKNGVYTLKFAVNNFGDKALSYNLSAYVMTEGVSDTKTNDGKTTVTEQGYRLNPEGDANGASVVITSVSGGGSADGMTVTVNAGETAEVVVTVTLSDANKKYLDESFANGMYVEGFVVLDAADESVIDLSVPYLAFYGDWTVAPMFDLDYYATNKDELDDSIDLLDKTLPDAYATRPIGGVEQDFVSYLGSYYFTQDPTTTQISADRKYISLSNQEGTIHSLRYVWAGLLRNADKVVITITEDSTGEVVYERVEEDIRKSYGDGGSIYPANIEIEFDAIEHNLNNNTKYTVTLKSYLDYGDGGVDTNLNNEFTFPLVTDFEAPAITGCEFYTEYDKSLKKTRLYAKVSIYDNHYAMSMQPGYVGLDTSNPESVSFMFYNFDQYMVPIYSEGNSTTEVVYELTDYINDIRLNAKNINAETNAVYNTYAFTVACYDYALNQATYEIPLPAEFIDFYFEEPEIVLSPNEIYTLAPLVYPETEWSELLTFETSNPDVVRVVNNKMVAVAPGSARIVAINPKNTTQKINIKVKVLAEGDEGYVRYDKPVADSFTLTGYLTEKAYYYLDSADRDIGMIGDEMKFTSSGYSLKMFPSEQLRLRYKLDAYFPEDVEVVFTSANESLVRVDENGVIKAVAEGYASVSVQVMMDGKSTYYSQTINIEIKEPYINSGPSLTHYFGNGGQVVIPESLAITDIGQFAFSNFDYIPKDENDEISEEMPETTKIWYIGDSEFPADDRITSVTIPEGVKTIGPYAFAGLTALETVILPSTIERIDYGAFLGCVSLNKVDGLENVKFINQWAFQNCNLGGTVKLDEAVAIADYSFAGNKALETVILSSKTQSVGAYTFMGNVALKSVTVGADKVKLGQGAFMGCEALEKISINASVVPAYAFDGCSALTSVTLGKDVAVVGEYAFRNTKVAAFTVADGNTTFYAKDSGAYLTNKSGDELLLVAPATKGTFSASGITKIAYGAFSGNKNIKAVELPSVTSVGNYAFADCEELDSITLGTLDTVGDYSFYRTDITEMPKISSDKIGAAAFAHTNLTSVTIADGVTVGENAFRECKKLATVVVGDNAVIGRDAFRLDGVNNYTTASYKPTPESEAVHYYIYTSPLHSLTIGDGVKLGYGAFYGAAELVAVELGDGVSIGDYAFYNAAMLKDIDLSKVVSVGEGAFTGDVLYDFADTSYTVPVVDDEGNYTYRYFAAALESVDLSSAEKLGVAAFEYCQNLKSVKLGEKIKTVSERAFNQCKALEEIDLSGVTFVGSTAFSMTALESVDLSSAEEIADFAFLYCDKLASVKFGTSACELGEGAFSYCDALTSVENLAHVTVIGDYAFAYSAITGADLTGAEHIGSHAFIKSDITDFEVKLGSALKSLGDNPFAMCRLPAFYTVRTETFNGKEYYFNEYTYDISDTVKVIDGSIYFKVPSGYELITYAPAEDTDTVELIKDTVRVSAMAFAGSDISKVILPYTVEAIGHKAFFACDKLVMVVFSSYVAPILEEAYDYEYFATFENIPATGKFAFESLSGDTVVHDGIEIVPYFMWNATSRMDNIYYGATFVDHVGHVDRPLVMVRPSNGLEYDSFILSLYFSTVVDGAPAADDITLAAIAAIDLIPEDVTLSDKPIVEAARAAYDKISTDEQRALVYNYTKLTDAEQKIKDLEFLLNGETTETEPVEDNKLPTHVIVYIVLSAVLLIAVAAIVVLAILYANKGKPKKVKAPKEKKEKVKKEKKAKKSKEDAPADEEPSAEEQPVEQDAAEQETAQEESAPDETAENEVEPEETENKTESESAEEDNSDVSSENV